MNYRRKYSANNKIIFMVTTTQRTWWWNGLALALVVPTALFLLMNILKFEFGVHQPYDSIAVMLEPLGFQEDLGFNINLLLVFGPPVALAIALFQVLHIDAHFSKEQFQFAITVRKKWLSLFIILLSGLVIAILFIYRFLENCNC
jgi:hypothetical protein